MMGIKMIDEDPVWKKVSGKKTTVSKREDCVKRDQANARDVADNNNGRGRENSAIRF